MAGALQWRVRRPLGPSRGSGGLGRLPFLWINRWKVNAEFSYLPQVLNDTLVDPSGQLGFLSSDTENQWSVRLQFQFGF